MSSQPTGDAKRPAVSAGKAGGTAAPRPEDGAGSASAGAEAADTAGAAGPALGTAGAADADAAGTGPASADAGRTTIVLDPEDDPPDAEADPLEAEDDPLDPDAGPPGPDASPLEAEAGPPGPDAGPLEAEDDPLDPDASPLEAEAGPLDPDAGLGELTGGLADDPAAAPVSKLAVLALVTGVLALVPIAVAAGIAALAGIRRTGRRGHGMAMAALFVSAAWVIVGGAVGTVGALTHGFKRPVVVKYHESTVFTLQKGECVNTAGAQAVSVLPCSAPHKAEVFATFSLPASAWPGTAAVRQEASSGCVSRLTGYLNPQLAISLAQSYVFPDKVAWTAGTRTVVCEVRAASGDLTGSVRGAS
jgi:hypothetical protein